MLRLPSIQPALILFAMIWLNPFSFSRPNAAGATADEQPYVLLTPRAHHTGYLKVQVGNQGLFSAQTGYIMEACNPDAASPGLGFVYRGGLWLGGVSGKDTLVSVVLDPDYPLQEFYPAPSPAGDFVERTQLDSLERPAGFICPSLWHDPEARSDQDLLVTYTDTVVLQRQGSDPWDGRPHLPLRIAVQQTSHSWSHGYGGDITIIDYQFTNLGTHAIRDGYAGLFVDHDIGSFDDDWVGFIHDVPAQDGAFRDSLKMVWCSDNDGDPEAGTYGPGTPTRALGFRFLRTPKSASAVAFNWWVENLTPDGGWGPGLLQNNPPIICGPCPPIGVPLGDRGKYLMLKNGEWDYDQNTSVLDHQAVGWLPPPPVGNLVNDVADGFDGKFVLSVGPFDLEPGATELLTLAMVAGREFHVDPAAFQSYWDPLRPQHHTSRLDFNGLVSSARWAGYLFDTPGLDSDGDGNSGDFRISGSDTVYYAGDGLPDFLEPPPPPAPTLRIDRSGTTLTIRWNGEFTESSRDPFLQRPDFEGYRVYLSRTGHASDFALLSQRDVVDYLRYEWSDGAQRWLLRDTPITLDSLQSLYGPLSSGLGFAFHPDSFMVPDTSRALCVIQPDSRDPQASDTACYYFEPFDGNLTPDDAALFAADSAGLLVAGVIRKVHPQAGPEEIWYDEQETAFKPYYEYEFALADVYIADPLYVAVTALDFGNPQFDLELQEGSPEAVQQLVYPGFAVSKAGEERPKPGLYPNPYRLKDDYYGRGWENPSGADIDPERARRITFFNLPEECKVTIWTLDGDLVKEIHHAASTASGSDYEIWNVITRNGERVRTGLYIWCVESRYGNDVGKLAVIR